MRYKSYLPYFLRKMGYFDCFCDVVQKGFSIAVLKFVHIKQSDEKTNNGYTYVTEFLAPMVWVQFPEAASFSLGPLGKV